MSACFDHEGLRRDLDSLAAREPLLARAIANAIAPLGAAAFEAPLDDEYANDDKDDEEVEFGSNAGEQAPGTHDSAPLERDANIPNSEARWEPEQDVDLTFLVAPWVRAAVRAIRSHRDWAEAECGLPPTTILVRDSDLQATLEKRIHTWRVGIARVELPSHPRFPQAPRAQQIDTLLAEELERVHKDHPIRRPSDLELWRNFKYYCKGQEPPFRDERYPLGWFRSYQRALGASFCWLVISFYASAWNRRWHLDLYKVG